VIEQLVKEGKTLLVQFDLLPVQKPLTVKKGGHLATLKSDLAAKEKIYNDAMSEITRTRCKYLDPYWRCEDHRITPAERERMTELGELWNRHLYYPQVGGEFVPLEVQGPEVLVKLAHGKEWRVTSVEADYDHPERVNAMTISLTI
jgi:hypothetical protein